MTFRKCRTTDITLTARETRVLLNLLHRTVATTSTRIAPRLTSGIVNHSLHKALRQNNLSDALTLPIAYAKIALAEFQHIQLPLQLLTFKLHDWISGDLGPQHTNDYFICTGDWSAALIEIKTSSVYLEAQQLQAEKLDYLSTEIYQRYLKDLDQGRIHIRNKIALNNPEKINYYFERFVDLFLSIQTQGFMTLEQARRTKDPLSNPSAIRTWRTSYGETNIGIAIGPQGEFIALPGGQHRLAVASVVGLPVIPAEIRMLHIDWIRKAINGDAENPLALVRENISCLLQA